MRKPFQLIVSCVVATVLLVPSVLQGEGRGPGSGVGGGGFPPMREIPGRGSPDGFPGASGRTGGLDRAESAKEQSLSRRQSDRAVQAVRSSPADYELDLNGALAIRGEVLANLSNPDLLPKIEAAGFRVIRRTQMEELAIDTLVLTRDGWDLRRMLQRLRRIDSNGIYEANHVFSESGVPAEGANNPPPPRQAPGQQPRVKVGLIDTGVSNVVDSDRVHITRRTFAPTRGIARPHGTAVAHLLGRRPGPVAIYSADIFGTGPRGGTAELMVEAIAWMAREAVPVINISMVGPENRFVGVAIARIIARGHLVVAPVGNDGPSARLLFPASYPGVIAVSAATGDGKLLPEASRVSRVDVAGPGVALVPDATGKLVAVRGTSFAAPVVSRLLADRTAGIRPDLALQAKSAVLRAAVPARSSAKWFGQGWLSCKAANSCDP